MSAIDSTTAAGATGAAGDAAGQTRNTSGALGKDDFLKLLVGQLQHQDPLQPTGNQEFIEQMTQFSILEQITNLATAQQQIASEAQSSQALSLIGRTVTYLAAGDDGDDGAAQTGAVEGVSFVGGQPKLTIDGVAGIDPAAVTEVR